MESLNLSKIKEIDLNSYILEKDWKDLGTIANLNKDGLELSLTKVEHAYCAMFPLILTNLEKKIFKNKILEINLKNISGKFNISLFNLIDNEIIETIVVFKRDEPIQKINFLLNNNCDHLLISSLGDENTSFNINSINQTSNLGQNLSHNNDSSFSNNGYNSVLENLLDHLDLSQKGWTSKLVSRIENALSNGGEEIEFNLKPKNLGMLKVSVSQKNGMNTVKIIAENSFVTSALVQNENYLQKLFNDQGMNLDFTAQNESQSFGSKSSFSQNSNDQHKNNNNGSDEKLNHIKDKSDVVSIEDDSSRHMINVVA